MKFKFTYFPPPTGPLSGKSFKEQTENAFNDIGQIAFDAADIGKDALADANTALAEAGNALEKANEALSTANRALGTGETAGQTADLAIKNAQNAQKTADVASAKADNAIEKADQAQATADNAMENGNEAKVIATANSTKINQVNVVAELAKDTSEQALKAARTGIYYRPTNEVFDLDDLLDPESLLVSNSACANLPVAEKGFLTVRVDKDDTGVFQIYQTQDNVLYARTGSITASTTINAGMDSVTISYQSSETVPYELDIQSSGDGADLSVTGFTGKSHTLSETKPTVFTGRFVFEHFLFNDGSVTVNGIPLADISLGNVTLTMNPVVTEHGVITATEASLDGSVLELTLSFNWTDISTVATGDFTPWSQLATQVAVDTKQDTLIFDTEPVEGSTNPVTSGGVFDALQSGGASGDAAHAAMPSSKYVNLTLTSAATGYTAPSDGYLTVYAQGSSGRGYFSINGGDGGLSVWDYVAQGETIRLFMPLRKGGTVTLAYYNTTSPGVRFYYCEGNKP